MTARRARTSRTTVCRTTVCRTTAATAPTPSASPHSTPVPTPAHPTDRAICVLRSPR